MSLRRFIYLDNHATTPLDPRVLEAMMPYLTTEFGNAASRNHAFGWRAEEAVEVARGQVAALIGASKEEIVFTSGATEADNLAIKGVVESRKQEGDHVVTTQIEHRAVLDTCKGLERKRAEYVERMSKFAVSERLDEGDVLRRWRDESRIGARVTYVGVGRDGRVDPDAIRRAVKKETVLVSVMLANNEIGTVQPIEEIGKICREKGVVFHCDAVQGLGKIPFTVERGNVDLVSISAHKLYGPKGVGALFVRRRPRLPLVPIIDGGGHERGLRSGTLNVAGIVGFGVACEIAIKEMKEEARRVASLRDDLQTRLWRGLEGIHLNGSPVNRLPGNLNVSFEGVEAEALMMAVKEVALSSGSACTSASLEPSYVLRACGVEEDLAYGSVRFGIGRFNTAEEIEYAANAVIEKVLALRELRPARQR